MKDDRRESDIESNTTSGRERELIVRLMDGYLGTQLLHVAARLGLADLLSERPRRPGELAAAAGADELALSRILRGLVLQGIVREDSEGMFHLTDAGHYLRSNTEDSLRGAIISRGDLYYRAAAGLLEAARGGGSAFHHACGGDVFETIAASPERLAAFQQSMVARARVEATELVRRYDFSSFRDIVDVGGGFGITLAAILQAYRDLRGTLFDRPEVIARAHEWLMAAGVADRCSVVPGDAFSSCRVVETSTCYRGFSTTGTTMRRFGFSCPATVSCPPAPACWWSTLWFLRIPPRSLP
jgi:O-methyltransferase domain